MNAADIAALRELLGREDVIEAAAKADWEHFSSPPRWADAGERMRATGREAVRAAFAAVLELAERGRLADELYAATTPDDDLHDGMHPQPGDPASPVPAGVEGWAL